MLVTFIAVLAKQIFVTCNERILKRATHTFCRYVTLVPHLQYAGWSKNRIPGFIFGITSVIWHRWF